MIIYNSLLAKFLLQGKKQHFLFFFGFCLTRKSHVEYWEEMEMLIRQRQFVEVSLLVFVPVLILAFFFSWWLLLLIPLAYYIVSFSEKLLFKSSCFEQEASRHCHDRMYFRKRSFADWRKWYGRKNA